MSKNILISFALLVIFTSIFSSPAIVCATGKDYCDFVNWIRTQESLKRVSSRGTSYAIPASHINPVGWQGFLSLASGNFTQKQINSFLRKLEQLGKIEFDGQESRFWDNDPEFCKPPGAPAGERQTNPSPSGNSSSTRNIALLVTAGLAILLGLLNRQNKHATAYEGD